MSMCTTLWNDQADTFRIYTEARLLLKGIRGRINFEREHVSLEAWKYKDAMLDDYNRVYMFVAHTSHHTFWKIWVVKFHNHIDLLPGRRSDILQELFQWPAEFEKVRKLLMLLEIDLRAHLIARPLEH